MTLQAVLASSIAIKILIPSFVQKAKEDIFLQNRDRNWQRQPVSEARPYGGYANEENRPDGKKVKMSKAVYHWCPTAS